MTTRTWMTLGLSTALLTVGTRGRADEPETPRNPSLLGQASVTADGELIVGLSSDKTGHAGTAREGERGLFGLKALSRNRLQILVRFPGRKPVALFVEPLPDHRLRIRDEHGESGNLECSMLTISLPVDPLPAHEEQPKEQGKAEKKAGQDKNDALQDQILEAKLDAELMYAEVEELHKRVFSALQNLMEWEYRAVQPINGKKGRQVDEPVLDSARKHLEWFRAKYLEKSRELRQVQQHLTELQNALPAPTSKEATPDQLRRSR